MATLQILESDYDSAKKKNNKIKMKAISNIIRDSKSFSRNPNEALIDTVVIRYIKKIKLTIFGFLVLNYYTNIVDFDIL